jgi:uncharacterized membrane protein
VSVLIALLLLTVLLNTAFQLSLKYGISALEGISLKNVLKPGAVRHVLTNPFLILGVVLMVASTVLWLKVLSMAQLSFAYPFQSLTLVLISVGSIVFLKERIEVKQWIGIALIILGIVLVSQS